MSDSTDKVPASEGEAEVSQELNKQCARALGQEPQMRYCECDPESGVWGEVQYFIETDEAYVPNTASQRIADALRRGVGMLCPCVPRGDTGLWRVVPDYSGSHEDARELEDEIERRGRQALYVLALMDGFVRETGSTDGVHWYLIRATPEQRARAFLAAVEGTTP